MAVPKRGLGIATAAADRWSCALGPAALAVIEQLELAEPTIVDTLRERHAETVNTLAERQSMRCARRLTSTSAKPASQH